jgi:hypothetical protein
MKLSGHMKHFIMTRLPYLRQESHDSDQHPEHLFFKATGLVAKLSGFIEGCSPDGLAAKPVALQNSGCKPIHTQKGILASTVQILSAYASLVLPSDQSSAVKPINPMQRMETQIPEAKINRQCVPTREITHHCFQF